MWGPRCRLHRRAPSGLRGLQGRVAGPGGLCRALHVAGRQPWPQHPVPGLRPGKGSGRLLPVGTSVLTPGCQGRPGRLTLGLEDSVAGRLQVRGPWLVFRRMDLNASDPTNMATEADFRVGLKCPRVLVTLQARLDAALPCGGSGGARSAHAGQPGSGVWGRRPGGSSAACRPRGNKGAPASWVLTPPT